MFLGYLDSTYGCILIHGCLAVGTNSWWQLSPIENKLLTMAITIDRNCSACDLPVFLPKMSPNVNSLLFYYIATFISYLLYVILLYKF